MKQSIKLPSLKGETPTIIALVVSALIFVIVMFAIHSEDFLRGAADLFSVYGDEVVEFDTATVNEVSNEDIQPDQVIGDASYGSQSLMVTMTSGRYKGQKMEAYNSFGALSGVPVRVNESVTLTVKTRSDGSITATVYELNRLMAMTAFFLFFIAVVFVVGRITGLKSLVGLVFTAICLFFILIPLLIKGAPAIPTTFAMCAYIAFVCFVILGGVHRKSMCAFLGTVSGVFLAMACGAAVQWFSRVDGLRLEDAEPLYQMGLYENFTIDIRGLLVASIIICSLGAVMDVAMSMASSLEEIHAANPALTQKELFRSGMNVGRDAAGTMTNTLILAFIGSEFTLMVFLYARSLTFYHLFSTAFVVLETISGLSSSIGTILAIPLTAFISSTLITKAYALEQSKEQAKKKTKKPAKGSSKK